MESYIIQIKLKQMTYFPNDIIIGEVHLTPTEPISLTEIIVSLQLFTKWDCQQNGRQFNERDNKTLISTKINIASILNITTPIVTLSAGKHTFPFEIKAPDNLHPSFNCFFPLFQAMIAYSLLVEVISPYEPMSMSSLIIIKSLPSNINVLSLFNTTDVSKWGMMKKGSTKISAAIPSSNYAFGDTIDMEVTIDNSLGELNVETCRLQIYRAYNLIEKNERTHLFLIRLCVFDHPFKCMSGQTRTQKHSIIIKEDSNNNDKMLFIWPYEFKIKESDLMPTHISKYFHCEYFLKITAYFESIVFSKSRPRVIFPITIHNSNVIFNNEISQTPLTIENDNEPMKISNDVPSNVINSNQIIDINAIHSDI